MSQWQDHFRDTFEPELLKELQAQGREMMVPAGGLIVSYGQMVRYMPVILSGSVKVSRLDEGGHELLLYYVGAGESCAMTFTCCRQYATSEIQAVAEEDVQLLAVPVALMDEWLLRYPGWKNFVMRTIRSRFNELLKTIDQVAFQQLDERLVHYLKDKARATGSSLLNLSHEQIAQELATSRVVVSRLLKKLEQDKRLLLFRGQLRLLPLL